MIRIRQLLTIVLAAVALVALAACGSGGGGGGGKSGPVEVVTHNAVGGGSDVFTRQMIKVMYENKIIDTNWPVRNVPAGDSIGAMSYMIDRRRQLGLDRSGDAHLAGHPDDRREREGQPRGPDADHAGRDRTPVDRHERQISIQLVRRLRRRRQAAARHPRPGRRLQHRQRRADAVGAAGHARSEVEVPVLRGHRLPDHRAAAQRRQHHARQRLRRRRTGEGRPAQGDRDRRRPASGHFPRRQHHQGAGHRLVEGARAVPCGDGRPRHARGRRAALPGRPLEDGRDRGLEEPDQERRPGDPEPAGRQVRGVPEGTDRHRRWPARRDSA